MPATRLKKYLDDNGVRYVVITHSPAYTSSQIADSAHIPGKELAKTVMVNIEGDLAMAVIPGSYQVKFDELRQALGVKSVELAHEPEFAATFPGCDLGAMPPFGNLYGIDVYVAESLTGNESIAFNAGTHTELIKMAYNDFERLVKPRVLKFSAHYVL